MNVNDDFSKRVLVHSDALAWESSPMPGVERRRLDRVGANDERVTTVVRYAPGSHFSPHTHDTGEEFVVLDGVFQDDYGHWPAGSYVRNPPTSRHQPGSEPGCVIMVKLGQFQADDRTFVHIDTNKIDSVPDRDRDGVRVTPLYKDQYENVRVEHWDAGETIELITEGGAELFVLNGSLNESGDELVKHSWLRLPLNYKAGNKASFQAGADGAKVWIKTGHLTDL